VPLSTSSNICQFSVLHVCQCYMYFFVLSIVSLETETVLATEEHHHFSMKSYCEECVDCGVLHVTTYKHVACIIHSHIKSLFSLKYSTCALIQQVPLITVVTTDFIT